MSELNEKQFAMLKQMCEYKIYVILAPHNMAEDSYEKKTGHIENLTLLNDLVKQGFMTNVTSQFNELLTQAREQGKRTFDAFCLTELAVNMFTPKEGLVN
jgi:hypothetical protein